MGSENIRDIKEVQNNPVLGYGVCYEDHTKARPIEINSNGELVIG